ncbi:MAG: hypothetical protein EB059_10205 [Alphaproteobacteria bacterium]|nr:hypothetical protein [Alphaproteobacteria bacterium]
MPTKVPALIFVVTKSVEVKLDVFKFEAVKLVIFTSVICALALVKPVDKFKVPELILVLTILVMVPDAPLRVPEVKFILAKLFMVPIDACILPVDVVAAFIVPDKLKLLPVYAVAVMVPLTSNFELGLVVPIPTLLVVLNTPFSLVSQIEEPLYKALFL